MSALPLHRTETYATRDAWLAARAAMGSTLRIGASEVASILGVDGAYKSAWDVWAEKTGALPREAHTAAELRQLTRGQRWEAMVLSEYGELTGRETHAVGDAVGAPGGLVIVRHAVEEWATCSPDGLALDALSGWGLVEGKTDQLGAGWASADTTLERADDYTEGLAPAPYVVQAYWQLETTGAPFVDLVCLLPRYDLRVIRILPDAGHQAHMLDTVGEWHRRHLLGGEPPPVDGSDACGRYLTARYPGLGKDVRGATVEEGVVLRELARVKAERKLCEEQEAELGNALHALLGDTYGVRLDSGAKALLIPMKGRTTAKLAELEKQRPDLFAALVEGGFVNRGADFRQLRLSGF